MICVLGAVAKSLLDEGASHDALKLLPITNLTILEEFDEFLKKTQGSSGCAVALKALLEKCGVRTSQTKYETDRLNKGFSKSIEDIFVQNVLKKNMEHYELYYTYFYMSSIYLFLFIFSLQIIFLLTCLSKYA